MTKYRRIFCHSLLESDGELNTVYPIQATTRFGTDCTTGPERNGGVTAVRKVGHLWGMGMRHRGRHLLVCICLTFWLELDVETRLSGQPTSADGPNRAQNCSPAPQSSSQTDRTVSLHKLPRNILGNQKTIFPFPCAMTKGEQVWPTIGVTVGTAALIASDPYTAPTLRTTESFSGFYRVFSTGNTGTFIAAVPAAMYGVGWLREDSLSTRNGPAECGGPCGWFHIEHSFQSNFSKKAAAFSAARTSGPSNRSA
jgi:hypothetical protein